MSRACPIFITLTGVDERTDLAALNALCGDLWNVEIGVLYSATPERRNRYPSRAWIETFLIEYRGMRALHICGRAARAQLHAGELDHLIAGVTRVQINGPVDIGDVRRALHITDFGRVITQWSIGHANTPLTQSIDDDRHEILIDASGGRGIGVGASGWPKLITTKNVGYAGGISAANMGATLDKLSQNGVGDDSWIDMESSLRADDWFSLDEANDTLRAFAVETRARTEDDIYRDLWSHYGLE